MFFYKNYFTFIVITLFRLTIISLLFIWLIHFLVTNNQLINPDPIDIGVNMGIVPPIELFCSMIPIKLGSTIFIRYASSKAKKAKPPVKDIPAPVAPVVKPSVTPSIEPKKGLLSKMWLTTTSVGNTVKNSLNQSQTSSSFKSLCKTCTTLKTNIKNLLWSLVVFTRLDKYFTSNVLFGFKIIGFGIKWILRGFTLFNLLMIVWGVYLNTPILTAKVIVGWLMDFFKVLKITYTDTVAKFLDYIISAANNGFKSVPQHNDTLMDYPEAQMYQKYRELFQVIKDLIPNIESRGKLDPRWYDFLRDRDDFKIYDPINKDTETAKSFSFIKDYWHVFAIAGGVLGLL